MTKKHRVLVTNDDGIHSPGFKVLKQSLSKVADIIVVVPDQGRSTASHSLTLHKPLRVQQVAHETYIINGTPADCVRFINRFNRGVFNI